MSEALQNELAEMKLKLEIETLRAQIVDIKENSNLDTTAKGLVIKFLPEIKDTLQSLSLLAQAHLKSKMPKE